MEKVKKEKLFGLLGVLLLALIGLKFFDYTLIWQLGRFDFQKESGLSPEQVEFIGFSDRETAGSRARDNSTDIKVVSYYNFFEPTSYVVVNNNETRSVVVPWLGELAIGTGRTHINLSKWGKASLVNGEEHRNVDSLLMGSWFSMDFDWIKHVMFLSKPAGQIQYTYKGVRFSKYIFILYFGIPFLVLAILFFFYSRKIAYGALYFILFPLLLSPIMFWFVGAAFAPQLFRDISFPLDQAGIPEQLYLVLLAMSCMIIVQLYYLLGTHTWKTIKDFKGEKILNQEWALIVFFWILPLVWAI